MKCLIYSPPEQTAWLKEYFPGINPYYLKILNKPLLEYYIDFCVQAEIKEIRVVNSESSSDLEGYFESGTQWGIDLSYGFAKPDDDLSAILRKNKRFCSDDSILLIYGYLFIHYDKNSYDYALLKSTLPKKKVENEGELIFLPVANDISKINIESLDICMQSKPEITELRTISDYYKLNMRILDNDRSAYFLPGYNNEEGVYLGKNIIDSKTTQYLRPLVLGDNVQIQMNTDIGPRTILGNNVIVDHSTKISDSIIYEHSYIGSELEIEKKIIYKKRLIDPDNGEVMQVVDSFLVSDIQNNLFQSSLSKTLNSIFALLFIILGVIPYLIFFVLSAICGLKIVKKYFYTTKDTDSIELKDFSSPGCRFPERVFFRLSLDLFPKYFSVLNGKLSLVGNQLIPRDIKKLNTLDLLPYYQPGLFSYSGSMLHNTDHDNYINDELEYCHTRSFGKDVKIVFQSLIARLFSEWKAIAGYLEKP